MSIIIGIICKKAIVVASDSQTTWGSTKRIDADKIRPVKFKDASSGMGVGLIANSGDATVSQRVSEIVCSLCSNERFSDERQLAEIANKVTAQIREELMAPYRSPNSKPEDFEKLFNEHGYSLLMASFHNLKPSLYVLDFPPGISCKQKHYAAVGCGSNLATFLLGWFDFEEMDVGTASIIAAFVINEVKKNDAYCGGATQMAIIEDGYTEPLRYSAAMMQKMEQSIEESTQSIKKKWSDPISDISYEVLKKEPLFRSRIFANELSKVRKK